jgi:hypothetical protein
MTFASLMRGHSGIVGQRGFPAIVPSRAPCIAILSTDRLHGRQSTKLLVNLRASPAMPLNLIPEDMDGGTWCL